ncbi:MAG: 4Fe-4S binding protein [Candidatus Bathyarchaeota archaeon]|nr:4Fe-4S binding protein [Candidatus Bathyarchaeota archaeon]
MPTDILTPTALMIYALVVAIGIIAILKFSKDKTRKISTLRLFIQVVAVMAVFMGLIIGPFNAVPAFVPLGSSPRDRLIGTDVLGNQFPDGLSIPVLACYYGNGRTVTCPIWQLQAYIYPFWSFQRGYAVVYSTSGIEKLAVVIGMVAAASLLLGRFFCGWLCPFGLYQDLLTKARKFIRLRHLSFSDKTSARLGQVRYLIIAVFLISSVLFASYTIFGTELIPGTIPGGPFGTEAGITSWINEPFCLVCPMRPLCLFVQSGLGSINWRYISQIVYGSFYERGMYITSINLTIFIAVTILALAYRRFWCRICPLGGLTALFSTFTPFKQIAFTKLKKDEHKCTKCGICKRACPTQATAMYEKKGGDVTESKCMLCARCIEVCPYNNALKLTFAGKTVVKSRNWLDEMNTAGNMLKAS